MSSSSLISQKITSEFQEELLEKLLNLAFLEDFGATQETDEQPFDLTTAATVDPLLSTRAEILMKEPGVIAGLPFLEKVMAKLSAEVKIELLTEDGVYFTQAQVPTAVARLEGPAQAILKGERLALNIMQRLSGIATQTRLYTQLAQPAGIAILDTRKTTPGLRVLERYGVRAGGGTNHRFGLFDAILIKDNHIKIAGGVKEAAAAAQKYLQKHPHIKMSQVMEVEVSNLTELKSAQDLGVGRVLLDNMAPDMVRQALQQISNGDSKCFVEVSGGVNLTNLESYLIKGVDAISTGALTHSAKNIDLSLEFLD